MWNRACGERKRVSLLLSFWSQRKTSFWFSHPTSYTSFLFFFVFLSFSHFLWNSFLKTDKISPLARCFFFQMLLLLRSFCAFPVANTLRCHNMNAVHKGEFMSIWPPLALFHEPAFFKWYAPVQTASGAFWEHSRSYDDHIRDIHPHWHQTGSRLEKKPLFETKRVIWAWITCTYINLIVWNFCRV